MARTRGENLLPSKYPNEFESVLHAAERFVGGLRSPVIFRNWYIFDERRHYFAMRIAGRKTMLFARS
jgi:hypothetical protein